MRNSDDMGLPPANVDFCPKAELAPKPEWVGSFGGFPVYINPDLANGWVQFRDGKGRIIGMISDVGEIHVASRRT